MEYFKTIITALVRYTKVVIAPCATNKTIIVLGSEAEYKNKETIPRTTVEKCLTMFDLFHLCLSSTSSNTVY